MPRYIKCRSCNETAEYSERFNMECVTKTSGKTGKNINQYYHKGDCWEKYLKRQEFLKKEEKEKDELDQVIKEIHELKFDIPNRFWSFLQDLRNGTNRFQKFWKKRYKEGVPYSVIKEAYKMSRQDISWARLNVGFKTTDSELIYCIKIVQGRINNAYQKMKRTEQSQQLAKAVEKQQVEQIVEEREVKWKKQESENDLSQILGDD